MSAPKGAVAFVVVFLGLALVTSLDFFGAFVRLELTEELRENIRQRGRECLEKLQLLQAEMDGRITGVQGTGLLFSVGLDGSRYKSYGSQSLEEYMRIRGINVIHGGENSLRYTPHFRITSEEIDLMIDATRQALLKGPVKEKASEAAAIDTAAVPCRRLVP